MSKQNFKSQAKRKRELAKLDKRLAKDQKRASRRAETSEPVVGIAVPSIVAPVAAPSAGRAGVPAAPSKPLTLAEAVNRWKNTKIVKARTRF
jgi:hypothetical protein